MSRVPEDLDRNPRLYVVARSAEVARTGLRYLEHLFGASATVGTEMAVRALAGAVNEDDVRAIAPAYVAALRAKLG